VGKVTLENNVGHMKPINVRKGTLKKKRGLKGKKENCRASDGTAREKHQGIRGRIGGCVIMKQRKGGNLKRPGLIISPFRKKERGK